MNQRPTEDKILLTATSAAVLGLIPFLISSILAQDKIEVIIDLAAIFGISIIFSGVWFTKKTKIFSGIDFYAEVGTVESYLWYAITSKEVTLNDSFSSSIGVNFYF